MCYSILDPTGNITALVESAVAAERQPALAAALMQRHPEVEQVGFVTFGGAAAGELTAGPGGSTDELPALRMAGGEFCGNATMSAAALYALRTGRAGEGSQPATVRLRVSGAEQPVEVALGEREADTFAARVHMPRALEVGQVELTFAGLDDRLPLVRMEGISHLIIECTSVIYGLRKVPVAAERAVCAWCDRLGTDGLGLMFLSEDIDSWNLTPLVYVPGSGTVFWERSCASGSAAAGMYLAWLEDEPAAITLHEPGGELRVESDPVRDETWLSGRVRLVATYGQSRYAGCAHEDRR